MVAMYSIKLSRNPDDTWAEKEAGDRPSFELDDVQLASFIELALVHLDVQPALAA